ncbi:hypothetical protein ACFORG_01815 [Lutimaribacter marinistellae]|uniref:Uncharacterized protein n=1 Tax=Lutimaribacter marinistellae TaxID=1820329 RepID=A0ABV7TBV9_9RHOB
MDTGAARSGAALMLVALRFLVPLLVVLTVVYLSLSWRSRGIRRDKLEAKWEEKGLAGDREAFVERGLRRYDKSIRKKLLLGVYIVPLGLIALLIYVTNYM